MQCKICKSKNEIGTHKNIASKLQRIQEYLEMFLCQLCQKLTVNQILEIEHKIEPFDKKAKKLIDWYGKHLSDDLNQYEKNIKNHPEKYSKEKLGKLLEEKQKEANRIGRIIYKEKSDYSDNEWFSIKEIK